MENYTGKEASDEWNASMVWTVVTNGDAWFFAHGGDALRFI